MFGIISCSTVNSSLDYNVTFFFIQIEKLDKQMTDLIPLEKHGERCLLRDKRLAALAKLKKNLKESE